MNLIPAARNKSIQFHLIHAFFAGKLIAEIELKPAVKFNLH